MKKIQQFYKRAQKKTNIYRAKALSYIDKEPIKSFYIALGTLVLLIIIGNIIRTPKKVTKDESVAAKKVTVFATSENSQITTSATVDKTGIIQIQALTSGVVGKIQVSEGSKVSRGRVFLNIASNYQGGSTFSTQRQLAAVQYKNIVDTYDSQKDIINKQKDIASKTDDNSDKLTDITKQSIDDTKALISLNDNIIGTIDNNLKTLELDPVTNATTILSTKQLKSQFLSANSAAKSGLRQAEYQTNGDNPPTKLTNLQREITQSQLDMQLKMLDVNKESSRLQLQLAQIAEGMASPAAPYNGVVQKIMVRPGQYVNAGTPLLVFVRSDMKDVITLQVLVTHDISLKIARKTPSIITIANTQVKLYPSYISTEAISGNLYGVYYALPKEYTSQIDDNDTVSISIPLNDATTNATVFYIPIDSIHQTSEGAYVYVAKSGKAKAQKVTITNVYGSLAAVDGLQNAQQIILDRTVIDGSPIEVVN